MGSLLSTNTSWFPRIRWVELHDLEGTPLWLRHMVTDALLWLWHLLGYYRLATGLVARALKRTGGSPVIVDLCSGSGGPMPSIQRDLAERFQMRVTVTLTDLYPNVESYKKIQQEHTGSGNELDYRGESVDAAACKLVGLRTVFASFHHFPPQLAQRMLQDAVDTRNGILVIEPTQRSAFNVLLLMPLLMFWVLTPLSTLAIRPFSLVRWFFTFVIPLLPLILAHDGLVSCLRTYTPDELRAMVQQLKNHESFQWEIGVKRVWLGPNIVYLIGTPDPSIKKQQ